ncbi:hypothetical protein L0337_19145 [candidate division KSB1 bacterium]|nr:hypothetical protein [candidate division KSB1 bacterium]
MNQLLFIASFGGNIEPAYQISKLCKERAKERFIVAVPRQAKSAATLVAIGADEIHIGGLGELGPIDPQIGGLPALGVREALRTIASLTEEYPKSSDMFARYLSFAVTVEQIGYCERLTESAVQYAQRLLATKKQLDGKTQEIAQRLVYEYKHHGFVIDCEEAQNLLGNSWVNGNSPIVKFSETLFQLLDFVNLLLNIFRNKQLQIVGSLRKGIWIWDRPNN